MTNEEYAQEAAGRHYDSFSTPPKWTRDGWIGKLHPFILDVLTRAQSEDKARLDWLEKQTTESHTGISFDYIRYVEDGTVVEKGYRFMRRHFLGERCKNLREAIDAARTKEK